MKQLRKEVSMEDFRSFFEELAAMVDNNGKIEDRAEEKGAKLLKAREKLGSFK